MTHLISFRKATDTDLQRCCETAGFKDHELLMNPYPLERIQRSTLIRHLQRQGFRSIELAEDDTPIPSRQDKQ